MSNEELKDVDQILDSVTSDLRVDDLAAAVQEKEKPKPFVKPVIHDPHAEELSGAFTADQIIAMSKLVEKATREAVEKAAYDPGAQAQVLRKSAAPITDFSKITLDDVYDLSVPIEAKPFMSADVLSIQLKDTNYEARWVNKHPQNLGDKIAKGFTFIEPRDLISSESIQTGVDAEDHYSFNDVVAMKIDKATYYRALRAAHERAVSTTNEAALHKRAASSADSYMRQESGVRSDYGNAAANKKMVFYSPDIEI